jgi:capsular exopolysaccharide synthesis family protein
MGRVEEAMRRAAEAAAATEAGSLPQAPKAPEVQGEVFPTEAPERPRLRPVSTGGEGSGRRPAPARVEVPSISRTSLGPAVDSKTVVDDHTDQASKEQYRRLATALYSVHEEADLRVLMVASAVPGEGKSLTASNLAMTFSESYQRRVLLIDGDLRRPSLHTVFNIPESPGLSDGALTDGSGPAFHHVSPTLTVLPAGKPTDDPMGILASDRMRDLIAVARETYDWVIVDTPPVGLLADASLVARMTDGAVLVVRALSTPFDVVQRAVTMLGRDRVLGVVLNRAPVDKAGPYDYSGYYGQGRAPGRSGKRRE